MESKTSMRQEEEEIAATHRMAFVPVKVSRPQLLPPIVCSRRLYVQLGFLLLLVLIIVLLRSISNMRVTFVHIHMESDTDGELVVIPEEFAAARGAFCLDGSPPAFYIRYGVPPNANNWLLHLQPGAWCSTLEECFTRSYTPLGSSQLAPTSRAFEGILSSDSKVNPTFYTWNMVQILYCDGASYAGNRSEPVSYRGRTLYMKGAAIFETVIDYLTQRSTLPTAEQVILAGSSAGGLAALIQADRLRQKLPGSVRSLHAVVDGAMFLDQPDSTNARPMAELLHRTFDLHNVKETGSLQDCMRELQPGMQWRCFLPENFAKHIFTPTLFVASLYDTWYRHSVLNIGCSAAVCPSRQREAVDRTSRAVLEFAAGITATGKHGVFLTPCPVHVILYEQFDKVHSNGLTPQDVLGPWLAHKPLARNVTEVLSLDDAVIKCQLHKT